MIPTLIRTCRIQRWCSLFSVFEWKYPVWANLVQKTKIISLSWNLVPTLIRICRFNGNVHFFRFRPEYLVWANLIQIVNIYSFFLFPIRNALFWEDLVQNVKVVSLRLNLLATIFCKIYLEFSRFHWKSWFEVKV